jgi:hypothetical protein
MDFSILVIAILEDGREIYEFDIVFSPSTTMLPFSQ